MICRFDESGVCAACGYTARTLPLYRNCPAVDGCESSEMFSFQCRAGTALRNLLSAFGISADASCSCMRRAWEMDANGCEWCEKNVDTIVGWLRDAARERGLPFVDIAGRVLVRRAIANARRAGLGRAR